jgi:hypothetical protein
VEALTKEGWTKNNWRENLQITGVKTYIFAENEKRKEARNFWINLRLKTQERQNAGTRKIRPTTAKEITNTKESTRRQQDPLGGPCWKVSEGLRTEGQSLGQNP